MRKAVKDPDEKNGEGDAHINAVVDAVSMRPGTGTGSIHLCSCCNHDVLHFTTLVWDGRTQSRRLCLVEYTERSTLVLLRMLSSRGAEEVVPAREDKKHVPAYHSDFV